MDLLSEDAISAFGMLVGEAIEQVVDRHDRSLDKRAAMMTVQWPSFSRVDAAMVLDFKVKGNRQKTVQTSIKIAAPEGLLEEEDFDFSPESGSLQAEVDCQCGDFATRRCCEHTLATAWWLQEQLARRGAGEIFEFLNDLKVDQVAAGRELVDTLLDFGQQRATEDTTAEPTRLQWRISGSRARYRSPITITAYQQRMRKNRRGWTKGREIISHDLLNRDYSDNLADGRIAAMVANPSYSVEQVCYKEFQALRALVGHDNVAFDDDNATPIEVIASELSLTLRPVLSESEDQDDSAAEADSLLDDAPELPAERDDNPAKNKMLRFQPSLQAAGIKLDFDACEVTLGHTSPVDPVVVLIDVQGRRVVVCTLRDPKATRIIQYLIRSEFSDILLDQETAARFSVGSAAVDSLVRIDLPPELSGPIQPVDAELVLELLPRPGAGVRVRMGMHDPRFRQLQTPGDPPETISCLTDQGPVRLRRDLRSEQMLASEVIDRFGLSALAPDGRFQWVATSDEMALDLLANLYSAGEEAPRLIWPEGESFRIRGEVTPSSLRVQIDDRRDWFGLTGLVNVDGREVPLQELLSAVRDNRSLVQVGDREFAKISDAFRKRLRQLSDTVVSERGSLKVADAVVPAVQDLIGDDVSLEATARWHQSIAKLEALADWTPEKPAGLDAVLRDYQLEGYQWLARLAAWGVGGVLADDMGLGKTVQTLGVLLDRAQGGPALIVAPTSVGDNWVREAQRFTPSLHPRLYRDSDRSELIQSADQGDLVIVSYQLLQRDAAKFATRPWHSLVLDEAQFIKNSQTKTSRAVRGLQADWRIGLSGTPLENHLGELWSLLRTLSPGLLGSWERFRSKFADPIERHKDDERRQSLAGLVRPFILRRTKSAVLQELPPRTEVTLKAQMSDGERKLYEDARVAALAELSSTDGDAAGSSAGQAGQQRIRTLAWLTRLRQLSCHPRLVDASWQKGSAKLDLFRRLVDELRDGQHRALVFSQFVKHLSLIRETLDKQDIAYQYLDGSTPAKERAKRVEAFQAGEGELFLISLKAGGTGLNLTAADYVLHLDPWWNPAVEDQATDRAHRIGQQRPVTVYRLVSEGTIEEQILEMHADKRELVAGVLDGTDHAGKMDTAELIDLIRSSTL